MCRAWEEVKLKTNHMKSYVQLSKRRRKVEKYPNIKLYKYFNISINKQINLKEDAKGFIPLSGFYIMVQNFITFTIRNQNSLSITALPIKLSHSTYKFIFIFKLFYISEIIIVNSIDI